MTPLMLLLVVFLFGYLATHLFIVRFRKSQYLFIGIEYILAGFLINPYITQKINLFFGTHIPKFVNQEIIYQIKPGVLLVLGFYGLIAGLKFRFTKLFEFKKTDYLLSFFEIFFSFLIVGGLSFLALNMLFYNKANLSTLISASYLIAIAASINSFSFIKNISDKLQLEGTIHKYFVNSSYITYNFGIILYGFIYAIFRPIKLDVLNFTPIEWVVLSLFFAAIMGLLFFLFLGNEKNENKIYIALIGVVLFSVGVSYLLKLSPIYITFIIGFILSNVSKVGEYVLTVFDKIYQPISVLMVIFAGIFWIPTSVYSLVITVIAIVLLRLIAKMFAGYFTYAALRGEVEFPKTGGFGLLPIDILLCGMYIEYYLFYPSAVISYAGTAILAMLIVFNIYGFIKTNNFLIDFDDVKSKTLWYAFLDKF